MVITKWAEYVIFRLQDDTKLVNLELYSCKFDASVFSITITHLPAYFLASLSYNKVQKMFPK